MHKLLLVHHLLLLLGLLLLSSSSSFHLLLHWLHILRLLLLLLLLMVIGVLRLLWFLVHVFETLGEDAELSQEWVGVVLEHCRHIGLHHIFAPFDHCVLELQKQWLTNWQTHKLESAFLRSDLIVEYSPCNDFPVSFILGHAFHKLDFLFIAPFFRLIHWLIAWLFFPL